MSSLPEQHQDRQHRDRRPEVLPQDGVPQETSQQETVPQETAQQKTAQQETAQRGDRPYWHHQHRDGGRTPGASGRFGENVLRGSDAEALLAADFNVNLRTKPTNPDDRLAEAHAVGFAAGWAQGRLEAAEAEQAMALRAAAEAARIQAEQGERFEQALGTLATAAARIEQRALPTLVAAEQLLVQGALELAQAVLGAELRHLPDTGRAALLRVLSDLPADEPVVVRISPADHAALDPGGRGEYEIDGRPITLIADPALEDGDAIGECGALTVDARLRTALERVKEVLGGC